MRMARAADVPYGRRMPEPDPLIKEIRQIAEQVPGGPDAVARLGADLAAWYRHERLIALGLANGDAVDADGPERIDEDDPRLALARERLRDRLRALLASPLASGDSPVSADGVPPQPPAPPDDVCDSATSVEPAGGRPEGRGRPVFAAVDLFGRPLSSGGRRRPSIGRNNAAQQRPQRDRERQSPNEKTLFDFATADPAVDEPRPRTPEEPAPQAAGMVPADTENHGPRDLFAGGHEPSSPHAPFAIASGEKAKARDILAAIRTLKAVEQERRAATWEERCTLARFGGFGPVALSIFPDPGTGRYKDAVWQAMGEELQSLLTPEEYDSAKRTTLVPKRRDRSLRSASKPDVRVSPHPAPQLFGGCHPYPPVVSRVFAGDNVDAEAGGCSWRRFPLYSWG